jgi:cysteine desulfurase
MANIAPSALRQASRLASKSVLSSSSRRTLPALGRVAIAQATSPSPSRTYVTESKRDNAQVQVETAIRLDKQQLEKAGLSLNAQDGSSTHVSPMAGKFLLLPDPHLAPAVDTQLDILKQATVMDEGQRPIYMDMQATTPLDPRVLDAMMPFYTGVYGNPHSRTHAYGWESEKAVEDAREHIATLIGADPKEIIFTSGATESNNMSIKGVARFFGRSGKKKHIITSQTEHKCVLDSCRHLQDDGFDVTYLPVHHNGLIDLDHLREAIRPDTALVSIMAVNNEIGVIQPLEEIGKLCREKKVFFHTDAAQAVGKIPMDVNSMNIDLMSISSHKIYGPKGIGACYVRRRPRVRLDPIISGGGQERGLRSGTLAPALVVGFGEACRIATEELKVCSFFSPFYSIS